MKLLRSLRRLNSQIDRKIELQIERHTESALPSDPSETRIVLRNVGLVSAGITVLAVAVVIGRELRQRYKFNRRTPYDFYEHAGDRMQDVEFSVGI